RAAQARAPAHHGAAPYQGIPRRLRSGEVRALRAHRSALPRVARARRADRAQDHPRHAAHLRAARRGSCARGGIVVKILSKLTGTPDSTMGGEPPPKKSLFRRAFFAVIATLVTLALALVYPWIARGDQLPVITFQYPWALLVLVVVPVVWWWGT